MTDREGPLPPDDRRTHAFDYEREPPSFGDLIRFIHRRRVRIVGYFAILATIGLVGIVLLMILRPPVVEGSLELSFRGIEKGEYPSGQRFTPEDLRAPESLRGALLDAGTSKNQLDVKKLYAAVNVVPVIPAEVSARWRKQDREGAKREEFFPNAFRISLDVPTLSAEQRLRLFDAIVNRYLRRAKMEQKEALRFVGGWTATSLEKLIQTYDYWDIPYLLEENVGVLDRHLVELIDMADEDFRALQMDLSFRDVRKDLFIWTATRLEGLKGLTYSGGLVKNRAVMTLRSNYLRQELAVRIRQKSEEAAEALKLLEAAQKPRPVAATEQSGRDEIPVLDRAVLDRLMAAEYMAPLVRRITNLQQETKLLELRQWRLEKDMELLPRARDTRLQDLPPAYQELLSHLASELNSIIATYNRLLDQYLTVSITSRVEVEQGPRLVRRGSLVVIGIVVIVMAAALALTIVGTENLIRGSLKDRSENPAIL